MKHASFVKKYNNVEYDLLNRYELSMDILRTIHIYLFPESKYKGKMRYSVDSETYIFIQKELEELNILIGESVDFDEYLNIVLKCVALIHMLQPFYDGNTRTCLVLQKLLLGAKGFYLPLNEEEKEIYDGSIAVLYDEYDSVSKNFTKSIKSQIRKIGE